MLKDRYFYPLAAIIVAVMVYFALSFGTAEAPTDREIWEQGYVMKGEDLARLTSQPGTQSVFVAARGSKPAYARLTSTVARASVVSKPGVFAPLGPNYERAFATYNLRLTITARASDVNGLDHFDMGYFTAGSGDSDWIRKELSEDWADYVMEFRPKALTATQGIDYFSMWPGETAELLNMDVKEMRVEVLDPPS